MVKTLKVTRQDVRKAFSAFKKNIGNTTNCAGAVCVNRITGLQVRLGYSAINIITNIEGDCYSIHNVALTMKTKVPLIFDSCLYGDCKVKSADNAYNRMKEKNALTIEIKDYEKIDQLKT